jgi:signal peptidase II
MTTSSRNRYIIAFVTIFITLIFDQWIKVWVKLNFYYGESYAILGDWFQLHFVENPGMAFGWEIPFLGDQGAKILLSVFRIIAVGVILYYLIGLIKRKGSFGLIISISLIFSGAFGNIIDSLLYGLIFSDSPYHLSTTAETVSFGAGYADFLTGKVVDMFSLSFFPPIFNLADVAISVGVGIIIVFQRVAFQTEFFNKSDDSENNAELENLIIEFNYGLSDLRELKQLEGEIESLIKPKKIGYLKGHEISSDLGNATLFIDGVNAEDIFEKIKGLLEETPFLKGAVVKIKKNPKRGLADKTLHLA